MLKYLNELPNDYREMLNTGIMNKTYDRPVVEYIFDSFKGLEILPNIKIIGYEWVPDEDQYNINDHVIRRNSNKNKIIKNVAETRCGVMYIDIEVSGLDKNGEMKVHYLKKPLIIPLQDDDGYYLIKGKKCYLIYQLVDKMLYPSFGAVTIKSLMPICVKTTKSEFTDILDTVYTIPTYTIQIFKNSINVLMLYSHLAITKTLQFMEVHDFIQVHDTNDKTPKTDDRLYFDCGKKSDIIVSVQKDIFEKEIYVKSITGCLIQLLRDNKMQYVDIDNWEEWMIIAGDNTTAKRGQYRHIFFNRLLDDVTRNELKINDYDKQDIYHLLRWILQNYHTLWAKDNLSMDNKRLRCNEYVGSLITLEISRRINRIVSLGDRATIKEYLNIFKFPNNIFVSKLYGSGVLKYSETINDNNNQAKHKLTKKGPNSLGANDNRRIPIRQRLLHPSMLGYLDTADTPNSEPGQSGSLSPYNDMTSLYFENSLYENEMHYKLNQYRNSCGLIINATNDVEYNNALDKLYNASVGKIEVSGKSNNPMEIVYDADPRDSYRKFDEEQFLMNKED